MWILQRVFARRQWRDGGHVRAKCTLSPRIIARIRLVKGIGVCSTVCRLLEWHFMMLSKFISLPYPIRITRDRLCYGSEPVQCFRLLFCQTRCQFKIWERFERKYKRFESLTAPEGLIGPWNTVGYDPRMLIGCLIKLALDMAGDLKSFHIGEEDTVSCWEREDDPRFSSRQFGVNILPFFCFFCFT